MSTVPMMAPRPPVFKKILRTLIVIFGIAAVMLLGLRLKMWREARRMAAGAAALPDLGTVPAFSLTDQLGRTVTLADLRGSTWVVDFIFTSCAGPCPIISAQMAALAHEFGPNGIQFISFTVDPLHDTPPVLADYARGFHADAARWRFLTGDQTKLYRVIQNGFHLAVEATGGDVTHSVMMALVDKNARIVGYFNSTKAEDMNDLRRRLRSPL